jgi:hypothetical protein
VKTFFLHVRGDPACFFIIFKESDLDIFYFDEV